MIRGMEVIVTAADITEQFNALISGRRPPSAVEDWAAERMAAEDARKLVYEPGTDEGRLWDAITYLSGVGLLVAPGQYLHGVEDFEAYRREHGF